MNQINQKHKNFFILSYSIKEEDIQDIERKINLDLLDELIVKNNYKINKNDNIYYISRYKDNMFIFASGWVHNIEIEKNNYINIKIYISSLPNKSLYINDIYLDYNSYKKIPFLEVDAFLIPNDKVIEIEKRWYKFIVNNYTSIKLSENTINLSLLIQDLLSSFYFKSTTKNFIEIEAIISSLIKIINVLNYCKLNFRFDSRLKPSYEQCFINGFGLLQIFYYIHNCLISLYKYILNINLGSPQYIHDLRELRNIIVGHPEQRKYFPDFSAAGLYGVSFDEEKTIDLFYEEVIGYFEIYILKVLMELVYKTKDYSSKKEPK